MRPDGPEVALADARQKNTSRAASRKAARLGWSQSILRAILLGAEAALPPAFALRLRGCFVGHAVGLIRPDDHTLDTCFARIGLMPPFDWLLLDNLCGCRFRRSSLRRYRYILDRSAHGRPLRWRCVCTIAIAIGRGHIPDTFCARPF